MNEAEKMDNSSKSVKVSNGQAKINFLQLLDSLRKAAFVVGSALLIFAAARNTITWHMQRFWGASGDFWQRTWNNIYLLCYEDDFIVGVFATTFFTIIIFWLANSFLIFLDVTGTPSFLLNYKVQPDKNCPLSLKDLKKIYHRVLFNQIIVGLPMSFVSFYLMKWRGCPTNGDLPTFQWVLLEITIFTLIEEVGFYYSHRILHHPSLYKHIHKIHHEWTAPIGLVALYAHPIEHLVSNMLPPIIGPILMGSHLATAWLWFALVLLSTTVAHSGYHFPFLPSPEAHDFHHLKFTQNFGVLGFLDRLHGTDNLFRSSAAYQRHILLLSCVPLSVQYPDVKRKKSLENKKESLSDTMFHWT